MKVGIVTGTHNDSSYIHETIASVTSQDFTDWICVVVDNGSTDNTSLKIGEIIAGDNRFQFFRKENEGPSAGRNFGYKKLPSDVKYIHFLDGDDKLKPAFLKRMVSYMDDLEEVGLLGCQFEIIDDKGEYIGPGHRSRFAPNALGFPRKLRDGEKETPFDTFFSATGQGPFALFRKEILDLTTGYEVSFWSHEDSDIFCQMALLSKVHYLPYRLYIKRKHRHNLTGSPRADYSKFREKWDFYFSDNEEVNRKIEKALRYYYGFHAPLRHFKIGIKAAKMFLRNRNESSLKWSLHCFAKGFLDFFLKKELTKRLRQRLSHAPHP